jgi:proton-coupled amino acid transporter
LDSINSIVDIPADEASKVIKKHLVLNSPSRDSLDSDRNGPTDGTLSANGEGASDVVDYTTAFKLPGGAITRDVYKWQADQENEQNRRGNQLSPWYLCTTFFGAVQYTLTALVQLSIPI